MVRIAIYSRFQTVNNLMSSGTLVNAEESKVTVIANMCSYPFLYRIEGNFRGRKLSRISRFFNHPRNFSPRNSRHATPIMRPVLTFCESFLPEMLLSYQSTKVFSLENFPLYGIYLCQIIQRVIRNNSPSSVFTMVTACMLSSLDSN